VFLWDVTGARTGAPVKNAGDKELASWWTNLAADDAGRAGEAIASLIRTPEQSVAFLKARLRPAGAVDPQHLTQLLVDLDGKVFARRDAASRELAQLSPRAEAALRRALKDAETLEMRRRLESLLEKLERYELPPETLRELRAVEALEHLATPTARKVLESLGTGAHDARLTQEAKAALARLARRS
jgi:hypothetical protein